MKKGSEAVKGFQGALNDKASPAYPGNESLSSVRFDMKKFFFSISHLVLICLLISSVLSAGEANRSATLVVDRDETCSSQAFTDHMISTDTVTFVLPETDGPVSGNGQYRLKGSGYSLSGPSRYRGRVVDEETLVLSYGQWWYKGKAMTPAAPEMPTEARTVSIPLEPGGEKVIRFTNAHADLKSPCSGTVIYRLKMERETQVWNIVLTGSYHVEHLTALWGPEFAFGKDYFQYASGAVFHYNLAVQVVLTKKKGRLVYTSGRVQKAQVKFEYRQTPELYSVQSLVCRGCDAVNRLKGRSLSGSLSKGTLSLSWPDIRPLVEGRSRLAGQCDPGQTICAKRKKEELAFSGQDDGFLMRAAGHVLALRPGVQSFKIDSSDNPGAAILRIYHDYRLERVK
ncbi:hypothetical protein [Desulfospira joergensenii]|uniref:hypothetical protein n=1 Tax=Desulfospira joergensenii TaxID=53329 RepID=UPI0003B514BF|nr:hypothetical protein [Desulfospira joergensenii]